MARGMYLYKDVLPFTVMVALECSNVGSNTLFKAATDRGMSYYVFIVYSYSIAALLLLPSLFFLGRRTELPALNSRIIGKLFLLGLIGSACLLFGYKGIEYGSPTLASAMSNLIPAFTFILAILFRMEKLAWRSSTSQAKILGTVVSIMGALIVILYKGPSIMIFHNPTTSSTPYDNFLHSSDSRWIIGGFLSGAEYILTPVWYIVQGLMGSFLGNSIHAWVMRRKGPVYISMFKPLSIAIAAAMGVIFLGDTLHLGSIIGAAVISLGFYAVMWGKATEEVYEELTPVDVESSPEKIPLLRSSKAEDDQ